MGWSTSQVVLGSSSSGTSPDIFVGDSRLLTLSVETQIAAGNSTVTVSLSDADGFQATIPATSYSVVTLLPAKGIFTLDPGARWLKVERGSASTSTVLLNRYYET